MKGFARLLIYYQPWIFLLLIGLILPHTITIVIFCSYHVLLSIFRPETHRWFHWICYRELCTTSYPGYPVTYKPDIFMSFRIKSVRLMAHADVYFDPKFDNELQEKELRKISDHIQVELFNKFQISRETHMGNLNKIKPNLEQKYLDIAEHGTHHHKPLIGLIHDCQTGEITETMEI